MPCSRLGQKLMLYSMAVSSLNASSGFTILKKLSWIPRSRGSLTNCILRTRSKFALIQNDSNYLKVYVAPVLLTVIT